MSDNRTDSKIDKILEKISAIDVTLAKQHVSLEEHMRRTNAIEKHLEIQRKDVDALQKKSYNLEGGIKILMSLGIIIGILTTLGKFLKIIGI